MSFEATVVRVSHEGSVLATFEGSIPQLGQRVKDGQGETIGRIDSVIGPIGDPLTNIVILDPYLDPSTLVGSTLVFAPRQRRDSRGNDRGRNRGERRSRDDGRRRSRDDGRNQRFRGRDGKVGFQRRDNHGGDRRGGSKRYDERGGGRRGGPKRYDDRDGNRRKSGDSRKEQTREGDWECKGCNNINFSFRTECNRCGKPKSGGSPGGQRRQNHRSSERRPERRFDSKRGSRQESRNKFNRPNNRGGSRGPRGSNNFRDRNRR